MLLIYGPALTVSCWILYLCYNKEKEGSIKDNQMMLMSTFILLHYIKRVFVKYKEQNGENSLFKVLL
jgi:hypothetical protein